MNSAPIQAATSLSTASAPPTAPATHAPQTPRPDTTLEIVVSHGKVSPAPGRTEIKKGRIIALRVRSDHADTLHVHGYDKEAGLPAGKTVTLTFTADRTGLFEVETHESDLLLTQLVVR